VTESNDGIGRQEEGTRRSRPEFSGNGVRRGGEEVKRDTPVYVKDLARELRKKPTGAEAKLWRSLRGSRLAGCKFRRQQPLGRYIADFYCAKANLAIELDGAVHAGPEREEYDRIRDETIAARGVKVLRFSNSQVLESINAVLDIIYSEIAKTARADS